MLLPLVVLLALWAWPRTWLKVVAVVVWLRAGWQLLDFWRESQEEIREMWREVQEEQAKKRAWLTIEEREREAQKGLLIICGVVFFLVLLARACTS